MSTKHKLGIFITLTVLVSVLVFALFADRDKVFHAEKNTRTTTTVPTVPTTTLVKTTESMPVNIITASFEGKGAVIPPAGRIPVAEGLGQKFNFEPAECYEMTDLIVDGVSVGVTHSHTFENVSKDHTVHAIFTLKKECHATTENEPARYHINATSEGNGSVIPSGKVLLSEGRTQKFTIEPAKCYAVADVIINGMSVGAIQHFTFENIQTSYSIHAVFTPIKDCHAD